MRILDFRPLGGESLFAQLGDAVISGFDYRLVGGHRLWAAPEVPEITYSPESEQVLIEEEPGWLTVTAAPDEAGIGKTMRVGFEEGAAVIEHRLVNHSPGDIEVAPWAITQLVPGGRAILPLDREQLDQHGLQASGSVVLWPYTDLSELCFRSEYIEIGEVQRLPLKVGVRLRSGWLAYALGPNVFTKHVVQNSDDESRLVDLGAVGQCYVAADFVELETLGPLGVLSPGEAMTHTETWRQSITSKELSPEEVYQMVRDG